MLHREETGSGEPLVLVHGAWADGRHWARLAGELEGFRVISYDRRGHGRSGGRHETIAGDVEDLAELIDETGAPVHVVGGSFGASVALRLAAQRQDLFQSLSVHEPALPGLLRGASGRGGGGSTSDARTFAEQSLGRGAWDWLSEDERDGFRDNGNAYRDEMRDPDAFTIDMASLADLEVPLMVSVGTQSTPFFDEIAGILTEAVRNGQTASVQGAGHLPHLTHAREYAELVRTFASAAAARR